MVIKFQKLDWLTRPSDILRFLLPVLSLMLVLLLRLIWLPLGELASIAPDLPAILVFHWRLTRPQLMTVVVVFGFGLLDDMIGGQVLGSSSLGLLVLMLLADKFRAMAGKGHFATRWALFIIGLIPASLVKYGANAFGWGVLPDSTNMLFSLVMTVAIYPMLVGLLVWLGRHPSVLNRRILHNEQNQITQIMTGLSGQKSGRKK